MTRIDAFDCKAIKKRLFSQIALSSSETLRLQANVSLAVNLGVLSIAREVHWRKL